MVPFLDRPINDAEQRVTPSCLTAYRLSHDFRAPSCLCSVLSSDDTAYTETAIFKAFTGEFIGEYMAGCAEGRCGYLGEKSHFFSVCSTVNVLFLSWYGPHVQKTGLTFKEIPCSRCLLFLSSFENVLII
jgi:hypothetical protein